MVSYERIRFPSRWRSPKSKDFPRRIGLYAEVASRNNQQPVTQNEAGVYLVSGVTPKIFELVVSDALNPYQFMLEVVESPRYQPITA